jgi:hypothetical protein
MDVLLAEPIRRKRRFDEEDRPVQVENHEDRLPKRFRSSLDCVLVRAEWEQGQPAKMAPPLPVRVEAPRANPWGISTLFKTGAQEPEEKRESEPEPVQNAWKRLEARLKESETVKVMTAIHETLLKALEKEKNRDAASRNPPKTYDVLAADPRILDPEDGDARIAEGHRLLQIMKPARSYPQERMHNYCIPSLLPFIMGKRAFNRNYIRELERLDRDTLAILNLFLLYRRGGKTDGAARLAAMLLDIAPDCIKCLVMAQTREMSRAFLKITRDYFVQITGSEDRIVRETADSLAVLPRGIDPVALRLKLGGKIIKYKHVNLLEACASTLKGTLFLLSRGEV